MSLQSMEDLFMHGLRDIYYAEKKIVESLPKLAKAVESDALREALESHLEETKGQVTRLEKVFENCDATAKGEKCPAIEGLVKETEEIMSETKDSEVLDAAILSCAQAVEHYEIARYGALAAWADMLGYTDSKKLLGETLEEEKNADSKLNTISSRLNRKAAA